MPKSLLLLLLCLCLAACGPYPRDAHDSSARAQAAMRVGLSHDPPYVQVRDGEAPGGAEVDLIARFAAARGLRVEWVVGGHDALMEDLLAHRLHMVAGGHSPQSPWAEVGWSRDYRLPDAHDRPSRRRLALPPGENAWHLTVDRWLHAQRGVTR
ncbi:ABC transporter substrate-binding protein [Luteimonas sp. 9C]|uniref:transporter substrate-binding domain-containing protein n=1 Tax=Luteimonas sp. 9C TaxID=2653148 RepID=UPI0012F058B7|nr:transporter substrate-binding domain-containing protein [Luteimonas sp. 9C]VXB00264.1 ABC transporter substrate-binding protein [Luteimonas sp. 9C]